MSLSSKNYNPAAVGRPQAPDPLTARFAGAVISKLDGSHHVRALDPAVRANADVGGMAGMHNDR